MDIRTRADMQVLLIEDDATLGSGLKLALERTGLPVQWCTTAAESQAALENQAFSAILLDLGLPDDDGLVFLRRLRQANDTTPVLIITANAQRDIRLAGLDSGADDYITKPYDLDEVIARLRVVLRRSQGMASEFLHFGGLELDLKGRVVRAGDKAIRLTQREFRVLALLAARAGRWVSKADLEEGVYDLSVDIESNTIESAIYGLRKKLGSPVILTARGLGYMVPK